MSEDPTEAEVQQAINACWKPGDTPEATRARDNARGLAAIRAEVLADLKSLIDRHRWVGALHFNLALMLDDGTAHHLRQIAEGKWGSEGCPEFIETLAADIMAIWDEGPRGQWLVRAMLLPEDQRPPVIGAVARELREEAAYE